MTPPALLLAGHGSADSAGAAAFAALRERVATLLAPGCADVAGGFIELSEPPLSTAVDVLAAAGHRRVVAVPVVLGAAGHTKGDIPAALAAQRGRHPGMSFAYGRPLGPHPVLLSVLGDRIGDALRHGHRRAQAATSGDGLRDPLAVLVVGRGSTDPDANAEMYKTTRLLWETHQTGQQRVALAETAFVSLARPGVAEGLDRCRRLGARRVVVARYFLFPGVLPDRVATQARAYGDAADELDVRCADVLGDCDQIAGLVAQRYREALTGDIRMNCDMCVYRAELPGFEHRVGAPQRPHYHPAEPAGAPDHDHVH
ncbi:MAG TPA: sirohydrochlorin chelatase [Streptosporangiaceae bacterium]|nr:sirohydrochlorin chelatase [Streptosporangiaceae bacterium]